MSKAKGYSLWLVPEKRTDTHEFLCELIRKLATQYQTPVFSPHVTLLGEVQGNEQDIGDKTRVIAEQINPYEVKLGELGSNETYFQILFSKVKQTPAVLHAYDVAQEVFGTSKGKYFPHLSLAYGDLSPEQVSNLKQLTEENLITGNSFLVKSIELWRTEGDVEDWHKIATFSFGKSLWK